MVWFSGTVGFVDGVRFKEYNVYSEDRAVNRIGFMKETRNLKDVCGRFSKLPEF